MEGEVCNPGLAIDSGNPLLRAVFLRRLRLTRLLLEGGAYINESDSQGQTPLMLACRTKHQDSQSASRAKLIQFLLEKGADPNIQDKEGCTALMHACREGAGPEAAALLLDGGADLSLEDQSGTSALLYAVMAGDWKLLKLLLDACKARGKEVIIITTDTFPGGALQAKQFLSIPPLHPPAHTDTITTGAPASPSEIQLITPPQGSSSLCPPKPVFSFKEGQVCGVSSHPCSPSRFRGLGQAGANGPQQPLLRLNSEPWLKIPASLLTPPPPAAPPQEVSLRVPSLDPDSSTREAKQAAPAGLLSSHSASHPNLHADSAPPPSPAPGGPPLQSMASSSLYSVIQRRKLGEDIYSSDPQLAGDIKTPPDDQRAREPADGRRMGGLRCSSMLGSRESLTGQNKRVLPGFERRGSGTFFLDRTPQARPRSLPPLTNTPILSVFNQSSGGSLSEKEPGQKSFLPSAPPGHPRDLSRRMLLRRHSIQTEQFKSTA